MILLCFTSWSISCLLNLSLRIWIYSFWTISWCLGSKFPSMSCNWITNIPQTLRVSLTILDWLCWRDFKRKFPYPSLSSWAVNEILSYSVYLKACLRIAREYVRRSLFPSFMLFWIYGPKFERYFSWLSSIKATSLKVFITSTLTLIFLLLSYFIKLSIIWLKSLSPISSVSDFLFFISIEKP